MLDLRSAKLQITQQVIWDPPNHSTVRLQLISSSRTAQPSTFVIHHHEHSNKHTPKGSAMCVQKFDDSQSSAIRITYRISLRSSSFQKPRYPSPIVVFFHQTTSTISKTHSFHTKFQRTPYQFTKMILPQVHLRKPCYDFTFL